MESSHRSRWELAALAAAALVPVVASAAPPAGRADVAGSVTRTSAPNAALGRDEPRSIRIVYRDLDVATPQGLATLYVRIRRAAEDVCGANRPTTGSRLVRSGTDRCVRTTVAATVRQIGIPGLAALEAEQQALDAEGLESRPLCEAPPRAKIII